MAWFRKKKTPKPVVDAETRRARMPEDVFSKCAGCSEIVYRKEVVRNLNVCPKCNYHFRIGARERLALMFDDATYDEMHSGLRSLDPLTFKDTKAYADRLEAYTAKTGAADAVITGQGKMAGREVIIAAMEYDFMGGSMGCVVGEKVTRAIEACVEKGLPLIVFCASGGARMQEGTLSLMQMAKVSAALHRLETAKLPYIAVLADPTTGGVTASFAMLGDLNVAEPKALIGFAGPRVIEQTIRQKLPDGFQRAEFLLEHGMLDMIVSRSEMKETLSRCLQLLS